MKKYFALLAIGTFALAQTATAQTTPKTATSTTKAGGTTTTKTATKTNTTTAPTVGADGKEKGHKGDKENKGWKEMKAFHKLMSSSFHPAEDKNFKPLRAKADSLYMAAVTWQKSVIPANFKPTETKDALDKLVAETKGIADAVKTGIQDSDLFTLINNAHETFHKIVGECRIDDGKEKEGDHKEGDHKDHKDGEHEKH